MAISMDLRVLARKLEKNSDDLLVKASVKGPEIFEKVATAIAAASTLLENVADDMDQNAELNITPEQLDEMAAIASAFDESGDPLLQKQASVLDEILLSIAAPKNAALQARKVTEDEINRLREERRRARGEEAYIKPKEELHDMWNTAAQAKAVEQQVKRYVPLEAPLQTRYPPDRPGGQMTRITDHVYQDIVTGIIYDFKVGYTTQKGNKVPGGSVENQTRQLGDFRNQGSSLFETRQSLMGRYASGGDLHHIKKYALGDQIAEALRAVRDGAPELVNDAIDHANEDGLSTTEVANILSDEIKAAGSLEDCLVAVGWDDLLPKGCPDPSPNRESLVALALNAIQELAPHLLKSAVAKARKEGLTDEQVKSVLVGGFYSDFEIPFGEKGEIKAAESLFPHLKALGWGDLIDQHLKVMASLGVNKKAIEALSGKKISESHRRLSAILKRAVGPKNAPDWSMFGTDEPPVNVLNPEVEEEAPPTIQQMPEMEEEGEEAAPPSLFTQMFGAPEPQGLTTPNDDLEGWNRAFEAAQSALAGNPEIRRQITEMRQAGQKEQADQEIKRLVNEEMNKNGFVGAFERDENDDEYHIVAKELMRLAPKAPAAKPAPAVETKPEPEPEPELTPEETKPATDEGKELPWEDYQRDNDVVITEAQARDLEAKILSYYNNVKNEFDKIFNRYTFPGSTVPSSVDRLPKEIKEKILALYMRGDKTDAVRTELIKDLEKFLRPEVEILAQRELAEKQEKSDKLLEDALKLDEEAEAEGSKEKKEQAEKKWTAINQIGTELDNPQVIFNTILRKEVDKVLPTPDDLKTAREALRGAQNKGKANRLKNKSISNARRAAANIFLKEEGLPPMYEESPLLTATDFVKQISDLGVSEEEAKEGRVQGRLKTKQKKRDELKRIVEKKRELKELGLSDEEAARRAVKEKGGGSLIHPIPEYNNQRLIPIWEAPEEYLDALRDVQEEYPIPPFPRGAPKKIRDAWSERKREILETKWDPAMKEAGFVPPTEKLFGNAGSTINMLKGLKIDETTNPLVDTQGLKNLFDNPDEYAVHYQKGVQKFDNQFDRLRGKDFPREWWEIHGGAPDVEGIPFDVQFDIKKLYENKESFDDAVEAMQKKSGVPPSVVKKVWDSLGKSSKKVQNWIKYLISRDADLDSIEDTIRSKYPNANIPDGVIKKVYDLLYKNNMHNSSVIEKWNNWSQSQGFYPPHLPIIGRQTSNDLLKLWRRGAKDPDVFGATPMAQM